MAYKFQLGDARLSGSLIQEGSIQTSGDILPLNADGATLGSTTKEWADLYLADSGKVYFGSDQDKAISYDPNGGLPGTNEGAIQVEGSQFVLENSDNNRPFLIVKDTSNDNISGQIMLFKDRGSNAVDDDQLGILNYYGRDSGGNAVAYANIIGKAVDVTDGSEDGGLMFNCRVNGGHPKENLLDINYSLAGGVHVAYGLDVNGHNGTSEGLRLGGTLITSTAAELNLLDGGAVGASITLVDSDGIIVDDGGTMKKVPASVFKTYLADNSMNVALKDNGNALSNGINYFADLSGAETANLPASPDVGDAVYVKAPSNCDASNTLTINRQGSHTIDGETSIVLESSHAAVMLVYVVENTWKVF